MEIIEANIKVIVLSTKSNYDFFSLSKEVKLKSPDYSDVSQEAAVADFLSRIQQYEKRYEPIDDKTDEKNFALIKIFNCGERFLVHKIGGY